MIVEVVLILKMMIIIFIMITDIIMIIICRFFLFLFFFLLLLLLLLFIMMEDCHTVRPFAILPVKSNRLQDGRYPALCRALDMPLTAVASYLAKQDTVPMGLLLDLHIYTSVDGLQLHRPS